MAVARLPAKSRNVEPIKTNYQFTQPTFKEQVTKRMNTLKHYVVEAIEKLMRSSPKLPEEVSAKYNDFGLNKYDNSI